MSRDWRAALRQILARRLGMEPGSTGGDASLDRLVLARVRALGLADPDAYVDLVAASAVGSAEWTALSSAITINYTWFFRVPRQLDAIAKHAAAVAARHPGRRVRIWSAGCSTGEEVWSLAMLLGTTRTPIDLLGTDVDIAAIEVARLGRYPATALERVPAAYHPLFEGAGDTRALPAALRRTARFLHHNFVEDLPPKGPWDIILCRNALIYLTRDAQERVGERFGEVLASDGLVFLGPAEPMRGGLVAHDVDGFAGWSRASGPVRRAATPPPVPARTAAPGRYEGVIQRLARGERTEARAELEARLRVDRGDAREWTTLGNLRLRDHAWDEAFAAYGEAKARDPLDPEVHYFIGVTHRKHGNLDRAAHALRGALFLDPSFWPAAFLLAGVYERQGLEGQRRQALSQALSALEANRVVTFRSEGHEGLIPDGPAEVTAACRRALDT